MNLLVPCAETESEAGRGCSIRGGRSHQDPGSRAPLGAVKRGTDMTTDSQERDASEPGGTVRAERVITATPIPKLPTSESGSVVSATPQVFSATGAVTYDGPRDLHEGSHAVTHGASRCEVAMHEPGPRGQFGGSR